MGKEKRISVSNNIGRCNPETGIEIRKSEENDSQNQKINVIIGLDISTTTTGFCVLNSDNMSLIKLLPIRLNKIDDFWDKVLYVKSFLDKEIENNWNIKYVSVEESVKRFSTGNSNANTIIKLSNFNSILCYMFLEKFKIKPTYINVSTARKKLQIKVIKTDKKDTKKQVLDFVYSQNKNFPWIFKNRNGQQELIKINQDLADSFVIAKACKLIYDV